ncbi:MAG: putative metal-binding motif-containing protein [Deltaproteobacteria bacterium]|nr:putative metal-binding motif-containing protein [Deltaproteobacteria bacterium]
MPTGVNRPTWSMYFVPGHSASRLARAAAVALVLAAGVAACGTKSGLSVGEPLDAGPDGDLDTGVLDSSADTRPVDCLSDAECDDGVFCNGTESCVTNRCARGVPVACVPPPDGCSVGRCVEALRSCEFRPVDADEDGHRPVSCGGDDCNDTNPTIFGGAPELCDYEDNDCDGDVDEGLAYVGLGEPLPISTGILGAVHPDVVFNDTGYHAVFDDDLGGGQVHHVAVSADGRRPSPATRVTFSSVLASSPDLTWTGTEMALWHHYHLDEAFQGTVSLSALDADGRVIRRSVAATPDVPDADMPAAAFNGTEWGVVYVANLPSGAREVRYLQARSDGTVTVPPQVLARSVAIPHVKHGVVWAGSRFVVAWGEGRTVMIQGRGRTGRTVAWTRRQPAVADPQVALAFADATGDVAVAWTSITGVDGVHYTRYGEDGTARGTATQITRDFAEHTGLSMSWSGRELAVVYQATRTPASGTFLVRFVPDLRWFSPPGAVDSLVGPNSGPAVAPSGREYGVAYPADTPRTEAVRFRLAGCE